MESILQEHRHRATEGALRVDRVCSGVNKELYFLPFLEHEKAFRGECERKWKRIETMTFLFLGTCFRLPSSPAYLNANLQLVLPPSIASSPVDAGWRYVAIYLIRDTIAKLLNKSSFSSSFFVLESICSRWYWRVSLVQMVLSYYLFHVPNDIFITIGDGRGGEHG